MSKVCRVCGNKAVAKELCNKHYKEIKRNGYIKEEAIANSTKIADEIIKIRSKDGIANLADFRAKKETTKISQMANGQKYTTVVNYNFINSKEEYNFFNGDVGMSKKVCGIRVYDLVKEKKYLGYALILMEALNRENQIVNLEALSPGESTLDKAPATDLEIAIMLGFNGVTRDYKKVMKYFEEIGLIKKEIVKDSCNKNMNIYYFNPLYMCATTRLHPSLFLMFHNSFLMLRDSKNKEFKHRYEQMLQYALAWAFEFNREYKEITASKDNISKNDFEDRMMELGKKIAEESSLNLDIITTDTENYEEANKRAMQANFTRNAPKVDIMEQLIAFEEQFKIEKEKKIDEYEVPPMAPKKAPVIASDLSKTPPMPAPRKSPITVNPGKVPPKKIPTAS